MITPIWQTASNIAKAHFVIWRDTLQMLSVLSLATTKVYYFNLLLIESIKKIVLFEM